MRGNNVKEHFDAIGQQQAQPYLRRASVFVEAISAGTLPPRPMVRMMASAKRHDSRWRE
jgi:hypothetical protein